MLEHAATARLCDTDQDAVIDGAHWVGPLRAADVEVVHRARGPVLDVGCGPGRHVLALARDGKIALGIDLTRAAVELARSRGASVLHRSVFARVPGSGRWQTALLLDGNIGIGGDPVTLLRRVASLVALEGEILVELEPPGVAVTTGRFRLELGSRAGPRFDWSPVSVDGLPTVAHAAGTSLVDTWERHGRWFAALARVAECQDRP